jgi:hypothetical protein
MCFPSGNTDGKELSVSLGHLQWLHTCIEPSFTHVTRMPRFLIQPNWFLPHPANESTNRPRTNKRNWLQRPGARPTMRTAPALPDSEWIHFFYSLWINAYVCMLCPTVNGSISLLAMNQCICVHWLFSPFHGLMSSSDWIGSSPCHAGCYISLHSSLEMALGNLAIVTLLRYLLQHYLSLAFM